MIIYVEENVPLKITQAAQPVSVEWAWRQTEGARSESP